MTLRFGTDGVRGPASEFTDALVVALGQAAAQVLGTSAFVIGRDTRESGERLERALGTGLILGGAQPLSLGVVPTPAVAWVCAQRGVPGAVISASHNPWSDNGIKFFAAGGRKLSDELEAELENALDALVVAGVEFELSLDSNTDTGAVAEWCDAVASSVVAVTPMRIVIDCANGAASSVAPGIFRGLGLEVDVLHAQPDGRNINDACGSTHPEDLQRAVVASGAALGLAFDGDADRLLAVDERGELVDGDQLIALFARDLHDRGELAGNRVVVTVMSNLGFRLAMDEQGIEVVETPVGDRHVLEALARTSSSLGGEQSGHIVFADREVEHIEVRLNPRQRCRFRNSDDPVLDLPSQCNLRRGATVVIGQHHQQRIVINRSTSNGAPGFSCDSMKVMEVAKKLLLEERVQLNLIERWHDSGCFDDPMQMFRLEVRNTY